MIWAVLDTNVWVSGLGWSGPPSGIVDAAVAGRFIPVTSPDLLEELGRVLSYAKLAKVIPGDPGDLVQTIRALSVVVEPTVTLDVIEADPSDNRMLEAAMTGHADYIVSGNDHLLDLEAFEGIKILKPADFLALFP